MARKIDCPCGETIRGENDDELVSNAEQHVKEQHPDQVGQWSREQYLSMATDE